MNEWTSGRRANFDDDESVPWSALNAKVANHFAGARRSGWIFGYSDSPSEARTRNLNAAGAWMGRHVGSSESFAPSAVDALSSFPRGANCSGVPRVSSRSARAKIDSAHLVGPCVSWPDGPPQLPYLA